MSDATAHTGEDTIEVRVLPVGSNPQDLVLNKDATVGEALERSGYSGATARVGGVIAEDDAILDDGDRITVIGVQGSKIEGGK